MLLKLTGQELDLWNMRQDNKYFTLDEMLPEEGENNVSILALIERQPLVKLMHASLREGDAELWADQVNGRDWLQDGNVRKQFFLTNQEYIGVEPPCPEPMVLSATPSGHVSLPEGSGVKVGDVKLWFWLAVIRFGF